MGGRPLRVRACSGGASFCRIGRRARRPPRAGLGGSLLEGLRPCQHHEGGARAPLGGVLQSTFPSGRSKARRAKPSGVRQQGHSGATGVKSHERRPPPTSSGSPSRRGWWAARLHRHPRAQQGRISRTFLAFTCWSMRGSTSQLRSHAFRPAERGYRSPTSSAEHSGSSGGQTPRGPGGNGNGPRGTAQTPRASRGSGPRWLMSHFFDARLQLHQLDFIYRTR